MMTFFAGVLETLQWSSFQHLGRFFDETRMRYYILGSARETVLSQRVQKPTSFILLTHNLEALDASSFSSSVSIATPPHPFFTRRQFSRVVV